MFIMPSFKKSLIVEQFQGNYLKLIFVLIKCEGIQTFHIFWTKTSNITPVGRLLARIQKVSVQIVP